MRDVWHAFFDGLSALAPFYFARLIFLLGRLPAPLQRAAFVPTFRARENAFRIGFLDQVRFEEFGPLADAGIMLAGLFGAPWFEEPLARMDEGFGCSFWCGRVASCPLDCKEKGEITRLDFA